MKNKIPIARCTNCGRTVLSMLCGKCKTMLAVIEKPKVARGYVAVPIISQIS